MARKRSIEGSSEVRPLLGFPQGGEDEYPRHPKALLSQHEVNLRGKVAVMPGGSVNADETKCANPDCEITFRPLTARHRYCRRLCRMLARQPPVFDKSCEFCHQDFATTKKHQKYCSPKCAGLSQHHAAVAARTRIAPLPWRALTPATPFFGSLR